MTGYVIAILIGLAVPEVAAHEDQAHPLTWRLAGRGLVHVTLL